MRALLIHSHPCFSDQDILARFAVPHPSPREGREPRAVPLGTKRGLSRLPVQMLYTFPSPGSDGRSCSIAAGLLLAARIALIPAGRLTHARSLRSSAPRVVVCPQ